MIGCGGPAPVESRLQDYDRLVELARVADSADPPVPAFRLGMSALPDSARRLMLDLGLYSVASTEAGWAWARGRNGIVRSARVYTLVPDDDFGGHRPLVQSRLGGTWVDGLYTPERATSPPAR